MSALEKQMRNLLCSAAVVLGLASFSSAVVVNGDFDAVGTGTTHVGADGAISNPGGTNWNRVDIGVNKTNLQSETGTATPWSLSFVGTSSGSGDASSTNNIQDFRYSGNGLIFGNLLPGGSYTFVAYIGLNTGFQMVDASGPHFTAFGNTPTYGLPGVVNSDYRRLDNLIAFDTGGGVIGLRLQGLDGNIGGFQLSGPLPEPASLSYLVLVLPSMLRRRHAGCR
jgi:hypothetical protein